MAEFNPELHKKTLAVKKRKAARGCAVCAHFEITWEPDFPRRCRYFGFKGVDFPEKQVRITTNVKECPAFERK